MKKIVYWSEDDGGLYAPDYLEGAKPDGSNRVPGFRRYRVPETITIYADNFTGRSDILDYLFDQDPPLATAVDRDENE